MDDSIDLRELQQNVADVLANECNAERVVRHFNRQGGPMQELWAKAAELGWTALRVPEAHGGLGLGLDAMVPIYEELGRRVAPVPFLATMLAADCLARDASPELQAEWLPRLAAGEIAAVVAPHTGQVPLSLRRVEGSIVLSGTIGELLDARDAQCLLVRALDADGTLHWALLANEDGHTLETQRLWDHGHTISRVHADNLVLPAERAFVARPETDEALILHGSLALAADAVGGAAGILELTIGYLKTRQQFGKPIGSFQALKHRVADHQTRIVGARSLLEAATRAVTSSDAQAAGEASSAKALACEIYAETARDCIQLHGGMGFTAEQVCHIYLKRARLNAQFWGDRDYHLRRATAQLLARDIG